MKIEKNEVYATFSIEDAQRPAIVRGSRILEERNRFKRERIYFPKRNDTFQFEDGEVLDGVNAVDRVRSHNRIGRFASGMVETQSDPA